MIELLQLTGIAAILRFPMEEIEDIVLSDDSDDDDKQTNENRSQETFKSNGHICTNNVDQDEAIVEKPKQVQEADVASGATASSSVQPTTSATATNAKPKKSKKTNKENYYRDDDDYRNGSKYDDYDDY